MDTRSWDASSYDRVGGPMTAMATAVVDRLALEGHEVVLDAGCGTGRVTELLLARLPRGRVLAVDADADMVRVAQQNLGNRTEVRRGDLLDLALDEPVDAVLSTATFHWVLDHPRLFGCLFTALRPGGRLVAQCGGRGNIADLRAVSESVATEDAFATWFEGWTAPWHYPGPEETAERLAAAGFTDVATWLEPWPVMPDDPGEYLATVTLGAQVQRLPEALRARFVAAVLDRLDAPVTVDYVRLNLTARRPEG
jgi:trans-aconitate 2-methyltransferase